MSAARLREAAGVLRQRAEAATPGPWEAHEATDGLPSDGSTMMRVDSQDQPGHPIVADFDYSHAGGANATYVATVSPPVALALADVLDTLAYVVEYEPECDYMATNREHAALADAILGGAG